MVRLMSLAIKNVCQKHIGNLLQIFFYNCSISCNTNIYWLRLEVLLHFLTGIKNNFYNNLSNGSGNFFC